MNTELIIIGGGYAGAMAANGAAGRGGRVTLVNARATFVERIRLHEVAAGSRESAELSIASLLHPGVELVVGWAERIDAQGQRVFLADGRILGYDRLVYAVGSTSAVTPAGTFSIASHSEALTLRTQLTSSKFASVGVIGGGLCGIELAAEIASARPDLRV